MMNARLAKFLMYYEIHRLKREDHSVRKITELLGLNRRATVAIDHFCIYRSLTIGDVAY